MSKILYDISVVLGTKNRLNLLKATIKSIRNNGFNGKIEIIVIDGGSKDGTCDWLAKQKDIFSIIQPNFKIVDENGIEKLAHSWGEFINIGCKYAKAPWIVMISDDLILAPNALQKGYDELSKRLTTDKKIGGGAIYFREYPRKSFYRLISLPNGSVHINHGFFNVEALKDINYFDEDHYNFYYADSDLIIRLQFNGWKIIALENSFADHLVHRPTFFRKNISQSNILDKAYFENKFPQFKEAKIIKHSIKNNKFIFDFWKSAFINCMLGLLLRIYDIYIIKRNNH